MTPGLLTLALAVAAPGLKDKPAALDLTGEWEITAYILGGKEAPPGVRVRFAADGTATFFGGPPAATHVGAYMLKLERSVRACPGVVARLAILSESKGDWVRDAARLAIQPDDAKWKRGRTTRLHRTGPAVRC